MNLLNLAPAAAREAIAAWVAARGAPAYRTRQILPRLWQRPIRTWRDATDLPAPLREALQRELPLQRPVLEAKQVSGDGTVKFLWRFERNGWVESVLIPERQRRTLCISSQAGCAYGCVFCATGRMGFLRHLSPWEITAQVREVALDATLDAATNIVFMGMGEPLHNWAAVNCALTMLNDPRGFGIGARRITVSTVGIVPALRRLAGRPEQFRVALSLHATTSERRRAIMPVERKYPLADVLDVLRQFPRRVTFEYVMIRDVNDTPEDAERLATLARSLGAHVNLLPLHPGGAPLLAPTRPEAIGRFARRVREQGANVTVRRSRGLDIDAACGQLRIEVERSREIAAEQHAHIE